MSCSMPRAGILAMSALVLAIGTASAGELLRPVPPDAQVTRFTRFNLRYSLRDIVANSVQKVEFYITEDMGRTWRLYGEDPDRMSPMTIEVPGEGVYGFVSVVTDRFGNREREPVARTRPETVIVVDRTPPQAKWIAPTQNTLGRGKAIDLAWESTDAYFGPTPVKIQYAVDARSNHDRDAIWNTVQENLSASGRITWTPPEGASGRYNFRLVAEDRAGNLAVAYNPATLTIDNAPPLISSVSPLRSNKLVNDIIIDANDGPSGSGVKEVSLYTSDNGGGTWTLVKETVGGESVPVKRGSRSPIVFEAPKAGEYGLWPVVFDEAGNATPLPAVGVVGPYVLTIDNEPPIVTLSDSFLMGRAAVLSNETRSVQWTAYDPHILNGSGVISLSLDNGNTWQELRSGLAASGSETINFPFGSQSEEAKLRVQVSDEFGNVGEAVSATFKLSGAQTVIDSVTPVGGSSAPSGGFEDIYGGDRGAPPYIAPPPGSAAGGSQPYSYPSAQPYPDSQFPAAPSAPAGGLYDPYSQIAPPTTYAPPTSTDPYAGLYQSVPSLAPVPGSEESSAGSLPRAMLGNVDAPPTQTPLAPPAAAYQPPAAAPAAPPASSWAPSPRTGAIPAAPSAPADPFASPVLSTPAAPATSGGGLLPPPPGGQTGLTAPPPAAPSTPSAPAAPSTFGDDWLSGSGMSGDLGMPPPLPSEPGAGPAQPFPSSTGSGLSLDGLGSDLALPPLPGGPAAPSSAPPSSLRPPGQVSAPAAPSIPAPASPIPAAPPAPAAPVASPLTASPAQVQPLPSMDSLTPPPLSSAPAARPENPRQLSEYRAGEAKVQLDQGNLELALKTATESLNADSTNPRAYMILSQVYAQQDPKVNNFARAATLAKEATNIGRDWESWWNCADVFYRWAHRRNMDMQSLAASGQRAPVDVVDERNQALSNAQVAIGNSASLARQAGEAERKKIATTQGLIAYLRALTVPEPVAPAATSGPAVDEYRRAQAAYKAAAIPILREALPYFQSARGLGAPAYNETFHIGIINFRLAGLEKDSGNAAQAAQYYQEAAKALEEATTARDTPPGGPREAYYMLAYCYDLMAEPAGPNRARYKELALRYWRQTADFYSAGTAYRTFAEQRIETLSAEMGR